jgi:hypothetical protein
MSKPIEIQVVGSRCVYVNDYRVAGGKAWNSEGLPHQTFRTTLSDLLDAFTLKELQDAVAERQAKQKPSSTEAV